MCMQEAEQVESSETPDSEKVDTAHRTPRNGTSLLVYQTYGDSMGQPETSPGEKHLYSLDDTASVYIYKVWMTLLRYIRSILL